MTIGAARRRTPDITAGVEAVLAAVGANRPVAAWSAGPGDTRCARAVRCAVCSRGGTLADEAMVVDRPAPSATSGRTSRCGRTWRCQPVAAGSPDLPVLGTSIVDLGDDAFTVGRPHPMIDPTLRLELLAEQAADPDVAG